MRQSTMFRTSIVLLLALAACATPSPVRNRPPIPVTNLLDLSPVESLGYEIYLRDQAAWKATDVALANGLQETPSEGWITLITPTGWVVRFVGPCEEKSCSYLDVEQYDPDEPLALTVHRKGAPLSDREEDRWHARQTALLSDFRRCTQDYNSAVVASELDGVPVWRVYLLASSAHPRDIVLTGHHRITTSLDGLTLLKQEALSKSCVMEQPPENVVGIFLTHNLDPEPIETHVFTSLDYRMPLYVGTSEGKYEVNGASIKKIDEP